MEVQQDFKELLELLNKNKVEYITCIIDKSVYLLIYVIVPLSGINFSLSPLTSSRLAGERLISHTSLEYSG